MMEFLKLLGYGVLYTVLSPFYIAFFVLNMIYSFFVYIFMEITSVVVFFMGRSYFKDDFETQKLKKKKEEIHSKTHYKGPSKNYFTGDEYE